MERSPKRETSLAFSTHDTKSSWFADTQHSETDMMKPEQRVASAYRPGQHQSHKTVAEACKEASLPHSLRPGPEVEHPLPQIPASEQCVK